MVELVGVPGPNSGAVYRAGGPRKVLNFYCTCLTMQKVMLYLDVNSLVMEHSQVNKAPYVA